MTAPINSAAAAAAQGDGAPGNTQVDGAPGNTQVDGAPGNTQGDGAQGNANSGGGAESAKTFTQEELDRIVGERLNRQKAQYADYDELKQKASEADELRRQVETESERAVREAREAAAAEERSKLAPRLVGAEFRAAAKGVLSDAQRDAFLEDADLSKYLSDTGEVDVEKVEAKVKALAPETATQTSPRVPRDMGQGVRTGSGKTSVLSAREDYLERRRKNLSAT